MNEELTRIKKLAGLNENNTKYVVLLQSEANEDVLARNVTYDEATSVAKQQANKILSQMPNDAVVKRFKTRDEKLPAYKIVSPQEDMQAIIRVELMSLEEH